MYGNVYNLKGGWEPVIGGFFVQNCTLKKVFMPPYVMNPMLGKHVI